MEYPMWVESVGMNVRKGIFDHECFKWAVAVNATGREHPGPLAEWFKIFITVMDSILALVAIVANVATVRVISNIREQSFRMASLLAFVVISDLATVICILTFDLPMLWNDDFIWVLGEIACRSAALLQAFVILFNSCALIAISVDRYRCVVQTPCRSFLPEWQPLHTAMCALGVSALCLGTSLPYVFCYKLEGPFLVIRIEENGSVEMKCPEYFCWSSPSLTFQLYQGFLTCLIFLPLLIVFLVCYSSLIVFLYQRRSVGGALSRQNGRKRKVMLTVGAMMLTFFVCRLPAWILLLVPQVNDHNNVQGRRTYSYVHYSLQMLILCAPAINPFLYLHLHNSYQQHLRANVGRAFWKRPLRKVLIMGTTLHKVRQTPVTPATVQSCDTQTTMPDTPVNPVFAWELPRPQHLACNYLDLTDHLVTLEKEATARQGCVRREAQINPCLPTVKEELSVVSVSVDSTSNLVRRY